jgi:hypothetical protein
LIIAIVKYEQTEEEKGNGSSNPDAAKQALILSYRKERAIKGLVY